MDKKIEIQKEKQNSIDCQRIETRGFKRIEVVYIAENI